MEIFFVSSLCLSLFLVVFSIYLIFYKKRPTLPGPLPPGRYGWPLIGESLQFLSAGWKGHPERFIFDRMARYSSVIFRSHLFGERTAVFCGAPGNKFLFSNENKLVQIWWPSSFEKVLNASVKDDNQIKEMFPDFLKAEALRKYIGIMDQIAQRHFELSWESKNSVKVFPLSKNYTFWIASRLFVSVEDPAEVAKLLEPFSVLASGLFSIPIELPGTAYNKALKASKRIRKMLLAIIKQRKIDLAEGKASETQDILSHLLLKSNENGKLMSESDIANKILGLLVAGYDTASGACTSIVKFLAELPEIYEGVYKEQMEIAKCKSPGENLNWDDIQKMKYSWNVAREAMRLLPPLQGSFREALTDFTYNGFSIPKGWKLYWNVYSTHWNPECFPQPEKFDPSRFEGSGPVPYTFLPFGGGPRMCIGKEYARLEILVFMHNLVKRFRWEKIIPDEKIILDPMPFPAKGLPVKLYPHKA